MTAISPPLRTLIAAAASLIAAHLSINLAPLLLGAVADGLQLSRASAGLLTSIELVAFGAASLLVAPRVHTLPLRRLALVSVAGIALGNLGSAVSDHFVLIVALRSVSGLGSGALAAVAYAVVAGMPESEKQYSKCYAMIFLSAMIAYLVAPYVTGPFLHRGGYGFVAGGALLMAPLIWLLPDRHTDTTTHGSRTSLRDPRVIALLAGAMLITFSDGLVWPMMERIGTSLGLGVETVGRALALAVLVGLSGSVAASRLGRKAGFLLPVLIGMWLTAIAGFIITHAGVPAVWGGGALIKNPAYFFLLPYLPGAAALLDRSGRASALIGGLLPVGAGLGPFPAGMLADRFGFGAIGWAGLGAVFLASFPVVYALRGLTTVGEELEAEV